MKTIMLLIALLSLALSASAASFRVAKDGIATYNEVQPAVNAAAAGDTIFIAASSAYYAGFNVDRRLVLYGAGTDTIPGQATIINGVVEIQGTADSTELSSVWITASNIASGTDSLSAVLRIHSGALTVRIGRCIMENTYNSNTISSGGWVGRGATASFTDCGFWLSYNNNAAQRYCLSLTGNSPSCQVDVINCGFSVTSTSQSYFYGIATGGNSNVLTVRHAIFDNCRAIGGSAVGSVQNSISESLETFNVNGNVTTSYCAAPTGYVPAGVGNIVFNSTDFVNLVSGQPKRSNFHLSPSSALANAGNPIAPPDEDGSRADIGIYGGQTPYVEFGLPDFPVVLELEVPASVPQNGALHVGSRGRVGPGN